MKLIITLGIIIVILLAVYIFVPGKSPVLSPEGNPGITTSTTSTTAPITNVYEIRVGDSGKTYAYPLTSRFSLILDRTQYPSSSISLACTSPNVLGPISNIPSVMPPLYAVRYEAVASGTCLIRDKDFSVTILVR